MKGRTDGFLLIFGGLAIWLVLWLAPAVGASSRNSEAMARADFDGLVHRIAERYGMHGKPVPMMWLANACANSFTHGGVRGMKVVEFEDAGKIADAEHGGPGFGELVKERLGERWSPVVREHASGGEDSYVYTQNDEDGRHTRLIVLDLDHSELNAVRVSLDPDQLAKWMKEQGAKSKEKASDGDASE
jgi:hypothetical protein